MHINKQKSTSGIKMKAEIKSLWVNALLSGEYHQGVDRLRSVSETGRTKFCCLGVLCNLHAQAHLEIANRELSPDYYLGSQYYLPKAVVRWAGLELVVAKRPLKASGNLSIKSMTKIERDQITLGNLSAFNDDGTSFKQIAKIIQTHL